MLVRLYDKDNEDTANEAQQNSPWKNEGTRWTLQPVRGRQEEHPHTPTHLHTHPTNSRTPAMRKWENVFLSSSGQK